MMYLFALWHCIPSSVCDIELGQSQYLCVYICNIVPGQLTIFAIVLECIFVWFTLIILNAFMLGVESVYRHLEMCD